jgi:hypothetical protein
LLRLFLGTQVRYLNGYTIEFSVYFNFTNKIATVKFKKCIVKNAQYSHLNFKQIKQLKKNYMFYFIAINTCFSSIVIE